MSNKAQLYGKILHVVSKMEAIEKSGYNNHQKYSYSTEEDLVNAIRALLIEKKLLILTSSETKEIVKLNKPDKNSSSGLKETLVTVVNTKHKLIDTETGEFEEVSSTGTGWDDTDKGSFKAITGAMKYFIGKNFMVPSKDDAENDGLPRENAAQQAPPASPRTFNKPAVAAPKAAAPPAPPPEEPKEELIKPAAAPAQAPPKTFARRTATAKEPNF